MSVGPRLYDMQVLSPSGFVRLAWAEWGADDAERVVICCHGLTRNGRDFDALASVLASTGWRVVAPDIPGRGRSEWLRRAEDYIYPFYLSAMAALIGRLRIASVDWVGTSMGGLIGMMLAAQPGTPIRRLVLNDIGALIPKVSLERLADYVGHDPRFETLDALEAYLRHVHAPFGALTDAEWRHLATYSSAPAERGHLRLHYDPAIAKAFVAGKIEDVALWPVWDAVACPTLLLRGAASDLLLPATAAEMTRRGAAALRGQVELREIAGAGHAPALMAADQTALVGDFLARS
ncbi:MAG TPA: alpha/beta fold hydrolase [Alphaproteobacteria bacterium]